MNLTISIDDDLVKAARIRALEQGTSVNEVLRQHLTRYAQGGSARRGGLRDVFAQVDADGPTIREGGGREWRREDAYDDTRFR